MISLEEGKKILNKDSNKYKDEEVKAIMKFLTIMAELQLMYENSIFKTNN